ncbi:M61 family metallopeptidase [Spongiivirga citrea]|uniref:Peptidase M61 n=1 Tax=Spongiivirga citrea TaxID=1481457 RepID=A0A6M0CGV7_9FLAO|nr:M61 family metallopeptidase [Spongiivirga citrea]NER17111.1 peptidase M61 [Spongiivirga citrea]
MLRFLSFLLLISHFSLAQAPVVYEMSFPNAVNHEAEITAIFRDLPAQDISVRMSRTSPGRYALHEFAKNVYNVQAVDSKGTPLLITRPDPYQWIISGHDGVIELSYTLFANRADGTYSQIDTTHAHLNIPATFMYAPVLSSRPILVYFDINDDLGWRVATQLKRLSGNKFMAPNFYYFMDSPIELSNFSKRSFSVGKGKDIQKINFVLHHRGSETELDEYFESVKKIVLEEEAVFGELPEFDFGEYTFLACYIPNASGDGMEHRNSTILTSTRSLAKGGMQRNLGTVSHEFFHAWNVERIRPKSLEPFDFENANMSGELWFAEGFTSYYTNLMLCRAGLRTTKEYVEGLSGTFNYVWNSPALAYFNPIEMSYQAPFVDAATSVDPVNRENTFVSYYSYGSMLGLALDLSLRSKGNLDLDGYMQIVWKRFGKNEQAYTIPNLQQSLEQYAGKEFADAFFNSYIYASNVPDYATLFDSVGVVLEQNKNAASFGARINIRDKKVIITGNPYQDQAAYRSGLIKGDEVVKINGEKVKGANAAEIFGTFKPGKQILVDYIRFGRNLQTTVQLDEGSRYTIRLLEAAGGKPSKKAAKKREAWLSSKVK